MADAENRSDTAYADVLIPPPWVSPSWSGSLPVAGLAWLWTEIGAFGGCLFAEAWSSWLTIGVGLPTLLIV